MVQNETCLRIICGGWTLFFTLCLTWWLEAFLNHQNELQLAAYISLWRSLQIVPYLVAETTSHKAQGVNLPVFWLLFAVQWYLVGSVFTTGVVNYFRRIAYLLGN